ncbi:MAG: DUF6644 family protein [Bryobacteraceae bacterium]
MNLALYIKSFFIWSDASALANLMRSSTWLFPLIEVLHLVAITLLLGMISVLDLRLMGVGMRQQSISEVARDTFPWTWTGIALATLSGGCLFAAEAMKLWESPPFAAKIGFFALALASTAVFQHRMTQADQPTAALKWTALVSLLLWFGTGFAGRYIAFY